MMGPGLGWARLGWAGQAWPGLGTQKQGQDFLKKNTNNCNPLNAQIKHLSKTARSQYIKNNSGSDNDGNKTLFFCQLTQYMT